ncbi:SMR family transporter [Paenibacillus sp. J2TS4]|uniref:SMR family transporter n=1 Tax=Paenibacillus sp. J2TS4 TaxID=2807194 RepID=UPI001B0E0022|nr:SMR family transporter [Paenibacillus sp. J2TS4]GIP36535.1 membrane protein [Paenibacillus sp. J2TS4]
MTSLAILLVLGSGLAHAVWNLFTKRSRDKAVFLWLIHIMAAVLFLPYFIYELTHIHLTGPLLLWIALSMGFQGAYFVLLSKAYSHGDMSQVYPIMRGTGALLVPVMSTFIYDESLSLIGWLGLGLIIVGLFVISNLSSQPGVQSNALTPLAVGLALSVGLCITGYTLTDKQIVTQMSPFALIEISNIGYVLVGTRYVWKSGLIRTEWQMNWRTIVLGSFLSPGSYLLFLFALQLAPLAAIAPIREVGTVFGTLLGILLLKEQQGMRRIIMASVITFGIVAIALWG